MGKEIGFTNRFIRLLYKKSDFTTKTAFYEEAGLKETSGRNYMSDNQNPITNHSRLLDTHLDISPEELLEAIEYVKKKRGGDIELEQFL